MIKKLRARFIVITMSLISIVLLMTFSIQLLSDANRMKQESLRDLDASYERFYDVTKGIVDPNEMVGKKPNNIRSSFHNFFVYINDNDEITVTAENSAYEIENIANEAYGIVSTRNTTIGTIDSLNLRYKIYDSNIIGFADITFENDFIRGQFISYSMIGFGSLMAMLIISFVLSNLAIKPVEKTWLKQQRFIADASHELKTPLTVILANTSILNKKDYIADTDGKKWLANINQEANHMKNLVRDLLFLARVDSNSLDKIMTRFDLSDTVFQNALPFEALMFEKNKELEVEIEPNIFIEGNQSQIKQLISIFIDNAEKYSDSDSKISLKLFVENNKACLAVTNQCDPISNEDIPYLFDRFYKADKARTREGNSYGLGLSIAKEIVQLHSGKINVESTKENGTTFKITLPIV